METAIEEDRLTHQSTLPDAINEAVIEQLERLYQMIHKSLVIIVTMHENGDLSMKAHMDGDAIDSIADEADLSIANLTQAAAFVERIKHENMREKSYIELIKILCSASLSAIWELMTWKKYVEITDSVRNNYNTHHMLRMTFLKTLLLLADSHRRRLKQAMTDGK